MKNILAFCLLIGFLFTSCDEANKLDAIAPTLDLSLTLSDANCMPCQGTDLNIRVEVTENDELHDIHTSLYQSFMHEEIETATEVMHVDDHTHDKTYLLETTYTMDTVHHSNFYLVVMADDHNGNESMDTVKLHVHM